jgi:hypothetical protein
MQVGYIQDVRDSSVISRMSIKRQFDYIQDVSKDSLFVFRISVRGSLAVSSTAVKDSFRLFCTTSSWILMMERE